MNNDSPTTETSKVNGRAVTIAVLTSVSLTVAAVPVVWLLKEEYALDRLVLVLTGKEAPVDPQAIAEGLSNRIAAGQDDDLATLAKEAVGNVNPRLVLDIAKQLLRAEGNPAGKRLAVLMIEEAAVRSQDATLLARAGVEYWTGRYVDRDFEKSMRFLTDPVVNILPSAHYFLGQVYLDEANPRCDVGRGMAELQRAADMGLEPAIKMLDEKQRTPPAC